MHFEAAFEKDLCIIAQDRWLALKIYRHKSLGALVLDLVCAQYYALTIKMCQDVKSANVLNAPVERIQDVGLLSHEFFV